MRDRQTDRDIQRDRESLRIMERKELKDGTMEEIDLQVAGLRF